MRYKRYDNVYYMPSKKDLDQWRMEISFSFANLVPLEDTFIDEDGRRFSFMTPILLEAWIYRTQIISTRANVIAEVSDQSGDFRKVVIMYDSDVEERRGDWYRPLREIPQEAIQALKEATGISLL